MTCSAAADVFIVGLALFTLASLARRLRHDPGLLLAARAVQGIGGALAAPSALALLMTMFPRAAASAPAPSASTPRSRSAVRPSASSPAAC